VKRVKVVKAGSIKVKPLKLEKFLATPRNRQQKEMITKKEIKAIAQRLELPFDEAHIRFTKAIINAYLTKQ